MRNLKEMSVSFKKPIAMRANITFFLVIISFLSIQAQEPAINWQRTIGGTNYDSYPQPIKTDDGGYLIAGSSESSISGNKSVGTNGRYDFWLVKLDSSRDIEWQKNIGASEYELLTSVNKTQDGGYILGGSSDSNAGFDKSENSWGSRDYWVVKINSTGEIEWENTIGGSEADQLQTVVQTSDGGYIISGSSNSNVSGDKTEVSYNGDYWIVKLNSNGIIQWQNTIGGSESDYGARLIEINGGYIIAGTSSSDASIDKTEDSKGGNDLWVLMLNDSGEIQWQNTIGGNETDSVSSISKTADGGYILGSVSYSNISGDKSENNIGGGDYWIVKLNSAGDIQWENTIGGNQNDPAPLVMQLSNGNYLVSGSSRSGASGDKIEHTNGGLDMWLLILNDSGTIENQISIGGSSDDALGGTLITNDGDILLTAGSSSSRSGDKWEDSWFNPTDGSNDDYWILNIGPELIAEPEPPYTPDASIIWQAAYDGGGEHEDIRKMYELDNGNIIIGSAGAAYAGGCQCGWSLLREVDSEGNTQWTTSRGGWEWVFYGDFIVNPSGEYVVFRTVYDDFDGYKMEIVAFQDNGNEIWTQLYDGNGTDIGNAVVNASDGGYVIGGYSNSPISGDKTEDPVGSYDYWILKINDQGNVAWDNTIGGDSEDRLTVLTATSDGGYVVGGNSISGSFGDKTEANRGSWDYWVVKVSGDGIIEWDRTLGGAGVEDLSTIIQTEAGGYLIGGTSYSNESGDKTENSRGLSDYWVIKLDASGNEEWQRTIGGAKTDVLSKMVLTADGNYLLGGHSDSWISGEKEEDAKGIYKFSDYWILKLDSDGNIIWQNTVGGDKNDYLYDIIELSDGNYLLGGESYSELSSDRTVEKLGVLEDGWLLKHNSQPINPIGDSDDIEDALILVPNPVTSILNLNNIGTIDELYVFDAVGNLLLTKNALETPTTLDLSSLYPGMYFVTVTIKRKTFTKKVIKQ